jgi:hypothetical protein
MKDEFDDVILAYLIMVCTVSSGSRCALMKGVRSDVHEP